VRAIVLGLVIAVALSATAFSQDYSPLNKGDFRNATWGMTKDEVRQSEQYNSYVSHEGIDENGEDGISYLGEWAGFEVYLRYVFVDDAFDHGICLFTLLNQDDLNN
jgi:hypothetical protein